MKENPFEQKQYWTDPYRRQQETRVVSHVDQDGIILKQSIFFPEGGGQPGDTGTLTIGEYTVDVIATEERSDGTVVVRISAPVDRLPVGSSVVQRIDWERRYRHMRLHTALHLLTIVIPFPVTGGQISADKGRLDFNMPTPPESKAQIEDEINGLVRRRLEIAGEWIASDVFAGTSGLVKTQMAQPPIIGGKVRLVRIGSLEQTVDLQPCGGTHVSCSGEVETVRVSKIENKGRSNRRVTISVA
ncbi:alanyl-tRNA editing protein [Brucella tritici]|uniref:Alanine--tRNA ligase n=1 Tax=Brucella tritici TaxID=94626 RepID=A0A6L3Y4S3_9HYPH|nr:alanyl-tRNA editing protein [Brucella tritici]